MRLLSAQTPVSAATVPALLSRRLLALGLHSNSVAGSEPAVFSDLRTRCGRCTSRERCEQDLHGARADPAWQSYCQRHPAQRAHRNVVAAHLALSAFALS